MGEIRKARAQIIHSEGQVPLMKQAVERVR